MTPYLRLARADAAQERPWRVAKLIVDDVATRSLTGAGRILHSLSLGFLRPPPSPFPSLHSPSALPPSCTRRLPRRPLAADDSPRTL